MISSKAKDHLTPKIFYVIPLTALFIWPNLLDTNGIPKLIALSIGTLIFISQAKIRFRINVFSVIPIFLIAIYLCSQFILPNNNDKFFIGSYGRAGGILSLILFTILFVSLSMSETNYFNQFRKSLYITYICILIFGIIQYFD